MKKGYGWNDLVKNEQVRSEEAVIERISGGVFTGRRLDREAEGCSRQREGKITERCTPQQPH